MVNSRDAGLLRRDVADNCRIWLHLCAEAGLKVLITSTVRDNEYQAYLYAQGRTRPGAVVTNSPTPTFHAAWAGLAFDFCRNIKGQEYSDLAFFAKCAGIAKNMGFAWGGDWAMRDLPHLQWGGPKQDWTSARLLRGEMPPPMPIFETGDDGTVTQGDFDRMMDDWLKRQREKPESKWSADEGGFARASEAGVMDGAAPQGHLTREQHAATLLRLGLLGNTDNIERR